jgi:hypothetical protein
MTASLGLRAGAGKFRRLTGPNLGWSRDLAPASGIWHGAGRARDARCVGGGAVGRGGRGAWPGRLPTIASCCGLAAVNRNGSRTDGWLGGAGVDLARPPGSRAPGQTEPAAPARPSDDAAGDPRAGRRPRCPRHKQRQVRLISNTPREKSRPPRHRAGDPRVDRVGAGAAQPAGARPSQTTSDCTGRSASAASSPSSTRCAVGIVAL